MKFSAWMLAAALVSVPLAPLTQVQAQDRKASAGATGAGAPVSMCIGCHAIPGYQASYPQVYRVPKIGGQSAQYIEAALKAYRDGSRNMPTMMGVARGLTDEQIAALGAYYAARGK